MNAQFSNPGPDSDIEQLRVPPQSIEAEQSVLGGLMLAPDTYERVADILDAEDFYRRDHQMIYRAISELAEKHRPYDAVTVGEWFESLRLAEEVQGGAYLIELASTTPSAANITAYAEIVKDKSLLRKMIEVGTEIVNDGFKPDGRESSELLASAEDRVFALTSGKVESAIETGKQGLKRTVIELERRLDAGDDLLGITSSLHELDEMILGLQDTDLIILAARPSMGKTALALQMVRQAAKLGKKPYTISMEMSAEQVYMRHIAAVGRVDFDHVQRPSRASEEELDRIGMAFKEMQGWQWWLDDAPSLTVQKLATRIRRMKKQHGIGIAFIDYLQFIDISKANKHGIVSAIQEVTRTLKSLAKELRIPIVLLSQLNRSLETRTDKRPGLADLRESGAIEQDADVIVFIHRQGYFEKDWHKDDPRQLVAEIIVGKARNGQVGACKAQWLGRYQQFNNLSYEHVPEEYIEDEERRRERSNPRNRSRAGFQPSSHAGAGIEKTAGRSGED